MANYLEEFFAKYQRPKMEAVTMGFSGIDPVPIAGSGGVSEEVVKETVREVVTEALQLTAIDCGEIV